MECGYLLMEGRYLLMNTIKPILKPRWKHVPPDKMGGSLIGSSMEIVKISINSAAYSTLSDNLAPYKND